MLKLNTFDKYSFISEILNQIAIFGALSEIELDKILSILEIKEYKTGDIIFKEGGSPDKIYIVKEGEVKLFKDNNDKAFEIDTFNVGRCFGQSSFLGIKPHFATAVCMTEVFLLEVSKKLFHKLSKEEPALFGKFLLNISREGFRENYKLKERLLKNSCYKIL